MKNDIKFDKKKHLYTVDGEPCISVTTFIKQHFPEFDTKNISKYVAKAQGKTPGAVRKEWKAIANEGSLIHKEIEDYLNNKRIPKNWKAMGGIMYLKSFLDQSVLYLPEVVVGSKKLGLAGTIDLLRLSVDDEGKVYCTMFDWKTNKEIKTSGGDYGLTPETEDLRNNHLTVYSLQMSAYKVLVEETLGFYIDNMYIVHLREDMNTTQYEAVDYSGRVKKMLKRYKK